MRAALDGGMVALTAHFAEGDVYLSLLFAYHAGAWAQIAAHFTNGDLRCPRTLGPGEYAAVARFLVFADLLECLLEYMEDIVAVVLIRPQFDASVVAAVTRAVFSWLRPDAHALQTVAARLPALPLRPAERDVPYLQLFVSQEVSDDPDMVAPRIGLLRLAVAGGVANRDEWSTLVGQSDFGDSQRDALMALAPLTQKPSDISEWLWRQGAWNLIEFAGQHDTREFLLATPSRWLCINARELVAEVGDPKLASQLYGQLKTKREMQWHFLAGLFKDTNFGPRSDQELRADYLMLACRHAPERVRTIIEQFLNGAEAGQLNVLLEVVKKNWIVNAVFVLYDLCDQVKKQLCSREMSLRLLTTFLHCSLVQERSAIGQCGSPA